MTCLISLLGMNTRKNLYWLLKKLHTYTHNICIYNIPVPWYTSVGSTSRITHKLGASPIAWTNSNNYDEIRNDNNEYKRKRIQMRMRMRMNMTMRIPLNSSVPRNVT